MVYFQLKSMFQKTIFYVLLKAVTNVMTFLSKLF